MTTLYAQTTNLRLLNDSDAVVFLQGEQVLPSSKLLLPIGGPVNVCVGPCDQSDHTLELVDTQKPCQVLSYSGTLWVANEEASICLPFPLLGQQREIGVSILSSASPQKYTAVLYSFRQRLQF